VGPVSSPPRFWDELIGKPPVSARDEIGLGIKIVGVALGEVEPSAAQLVAVGDGGDIDFLVDEVLRIGRDAEGSTG
jgi:hypothetical protein